MLVVSPRTGRGGRWAPRSQSSSSWPGVVLVVQVGQVGRVGRGSVGECWRMCVAGAGAARGGARAVGAGARAGAGPGRSTRRGGGPPAAPTRRGSWSWSPQPAWPPARQGGTQSRPPEKYLYSTKIFLKDYSEFDTRRYGAFLQRKYVQYNCGRMREYSFIRGKNFKKCFVDKYFLYLFGIYTKFWNKYKLWVNIFPFHKSQNTRSEILVLLCAQ